MVFGAPTSIPAYTVKGQRVVAKGFGSDFDLTTSIVRNTVSGAVGTVIDKKVKHGAGFAFGLAVDLWEAWQVKNVTEHKDEPLVWSTTLGEALYPCDFITLVVMVKSMNDITSQAISVLVSSTYSDDSGAYPISRTNSIVLGSFGSVVPQTDPLVGGSFSGVNTESTLSISHLSPRGSEDGVAFSYFLVYAVYQNPFGCCGAAEGYTFTDNKLVMTLPPVQGAIIDQDASGFFDYSNEGSRVIPSLFLKIGADVIGEFNPVLG